MFFLFFNCFVFLSFSAEKAKISIWKTTKFTPLLTPPSMVYALSLKMRGSPFKKKKKKKRARISAHRRDKIQMSRRLRFRYFSISSWVRALLLPLGVTFLTGRGGDFRQPSLAKISSAVIPPYSASNAFPRIVSSHDSIWFTARRQVLQFPSGRVQARLCFSTMSAT